MNVAKRWFPSFLGFEQSSMPIKWMEMARRQTMQGDQERRHRERNHFGRLQIVFVFTRTADEKTEFDPKSSSQHFHRERQQGCTRGKWRQRENLLRWGQYLGSWALAGLDFQAKPWLWQGTDKGLTRDWKGTGTDKVLGTDKGLARGWGLGRGWENRGFPSLFQNSASSLSCLLLTWK